MHNHHFPFFFLTNKTGNDQMECEGIIKPLLSKDIISSFRISKCSFDNL